MVPGRPAMSKSRAKNSIAIPDITIRPISGMTIKLISMPYTGNVKKFQASIGSMTSCMERLISMVLTYPLSLYLPEIYLCLPEFFPFALSLSIPRISSFPANVMAATAAKDS